MPPDGGGCGADGNRGGGKPLQARAGLCRAGGGLPDARTDRHDEGGRMYAAVLRRSHPLLPIHAGDVVNEDILGTKVQIIAMQNLDPK